MFLFLCATRAEAAEILQDGLRLTEELRGRFHRTLEAAELHCPDLILIARREPIDDAIPGGAGASIRVPADVFVNLDPYQPPRRVDAAGGYLMRPGTNEPEVLLIFRRGRWDLPKGKRDPGETLEACALREVREELGITQVKLVAPLGTTLHGYPERGRYRIKTTHWFLMNTSEVRFRPQAEEDIERVAWMPYGEALRCVGFSTLHDHMRAVRPLVFEHLDV